MNSHLFGIHNYHYLLRKMFLIWRDLIDFDRHGISVPSMLTFWMISYLRPDFDSLCTDDRGDFLGPFGAGEFLEKNQILLPLINSTIHHTISFAGFIFLLF